VKIIFFLERGSKIILPRLSWCCQLWLWLWSLWFWDTRSHYYV